MNKEEFINKYNMMELTEKDGFDIDIVYATPNNFTKQILYSKPICMLRKSTAEKLINANECLNKLGYKIKIIDTFRPLEYQEKMFEIYPNENYVANPAKGNNNHCKGSAVDISLCGLDGSNVYMPTEFDHFGEESYRSYFSRLPLPVRRNVMLLESIMVKSGFSPYPFEWWHFNDVDNYDIIQDSFN
ncbi:MAG TPA: M15 family metallopeptidase [Bacilli bacterium]|nr:M15 family metallopeptidase [Bacilli bacterium]